MNKETGTSCSKDSHTFKKFIGFRFSSRPMAHMTVFLIQQFSRWSGFSRESPRPLQGTLRLKQRPHFGSPLPHPDGRPPAFSSMGAARVISNKCHLTSSLPTTSQGFAGIPSDAAQGMTERMMSRAGDTS